MRRTLALALTLTAALTAPALAGPPEVKCTRFGMYAPEVEAAYQSLPSEVHWAVDTACGWD